MFDLAAVLADAQRKEALTDWGPGEFEYPLDVLLADYAIADLNAVGVHILRSGIVHSLRMRLRAQEWIRQNIPPGVSLADELSAERREAAKHE